MSVVSRGSYFSSQSSIGSTGLNSAGGMHFSTVGGGRSRMSMSASSVGGRALSVYGGAGGQSTRISQSVSAFSMSAPSSDIILTSDEKGTMKNLNDRLATYLEKVHSLESANRQLELQIKEFYEKKSPIHSKDLTAYFGTISGLRKQILTRYMENAEMTLQMENTQLAAEDFKMKFETELNMRLMVEEDQARLRGILDGFSLSRGDLELQAEGLKEEQVYLKKNHEEELQRLRAQQCGGVNVEMDCAASADLNEELRSMREQYEALVQKYQREAERWFQGKVEALQVQITTSTTEVKTSQSQLGDLKRTFMSLEIELQGLVTQKQYLELSVADVSGRYGEQIGELQLRINATEVELQRLNARIQQQASEYQVLLDIKMRLEMEIAEYRRLLDGEAHSHRVLVSTTDHLNTVHKVQEVVEQKEVVVEKVQEVVEQKVVVVEKVQEVHVQEEEHNPHVQRRVKTIIEEIVDGKVVSISSSENIQELS